MSISSCGLSRHAHMHSHLLQFQYSYNIFSEEFCTLVGVPNWILVFNWIDSIHIGRLRSIQSRKNQLVCLRHNYIICVWWHACYKLLNMRFISLAILQWDFIEILWEFQGWCPSQKFLYSIAIELKLSRIHAPQVRAHIYSLSNSNQFMRWHKMASFGLFPNQNKNVK